MSSGVLPVLSTQYTPRGCHFYIVLSLINAMLDATGRPTFDMALSTKSI